MRPTLLAAALLASSAALAGTADVKFIDPANFTDLATNRWEEADTMRAISAHLQRLAQQLPADQALQVEVLDVDLAGTWRQTPRGRIRSATNLADPPKIHLRYSLVAGGQVLRSGEEHLTDLDYTNHLVVRDASTPLFHEKRLLDTWFARNFGAQPHALAR